MQLEKLNVIEKFDPNKFHPNMKIFMEARRAGRTLSLIPRFWHSLFSKYRGNIEMPYGFVKVRYKKRKIN